MDQNLTVFKLWMRAATAEEQQLLAHRVGTSRQYLYMLSANDDAKYKREPGAVLAAAIERETALMHKASNGRLPLIYRTDLVKACASCEFAKRCLGAAALRSEFPLVSPDNIEGDRNGD